MRILHVGLFHKLGSGQRAQLEYERSAASGLENAVWHTHTLTPDADRTDDGPKVPRWARRFQLAKLFTWCHIVRTARKYDAVLMRTISPDPFAAFMAPLIPNLYTIHHSKEREELALLTSGIRRRMTLFLEGRLKTWAFRRLRGVIGVTEEIALYESRRFPHAAVVATYPNGIDLGGLPVSDAIPATTGPIHAVFVSSVFYSWQGLDRLLSALAESAPHIQNSLVVHLVGRLEDEQLPLAEQLAARGVVKLHGELTPDQMSPVLAGAQVAIASLALDRKDLLQASTLKVREYLAAGLPVYSTHEDSGLPSHFEYYFCDGKGVSIERIVAFHDGLVDRARSSVREAARPYIDKQAIMKRLIEQLRTPTAHESALLRARRS
ncbi:glycosyltransferase [Microbacterium azadirachtae]|uniref:Uncharacterized protein n=1 Tax=Microbacterium azadirachtae TaxID=582680 RepID=A0A0F0L0X9_9MICO|nr:glycosyltransferase [Microbacterium azadirachtae]KJL26329.1 hypothetical protein RL72_01045 [Microbacterium azadirachtae]UXW85244.1 glycosyltransferase [Microbacterium azadirachtae]SDM43045.1 Glycosyltransferase involved in cell wall bisynthesis [Microbacterium azadirachtae]SEG57340.1 Glycosyltransferase involved in cell wall bisynthesis [Microbacterium azadirachtae]SEG60287.1 Glycosyltransferase involved in cell wall bisynthesis [Microbacterium azadirachtae]